MQHKEKGGIEPRREIPHKLVVTVLEKEIRNTRIVERISLTCSEDFRCPDGVDTVQT